MAVEHRCVVDLVGHVAGQPGQREHLGAVAAAHRGDRAQHEELGDAVEQHVRRPLALADRGSGGLQRSSPAASRSACSEAIERICSGGQPGLEGGAEHERRRHRVAPYGASLANRIWPGGTSENSVARSAGIHQAVSNSRLGWSGATRQIQDRSQMPAWARISRASGNSPASATACAPERGDAAAGVDQNRQPSARRRARRAAHLGMVERELLGARMQLDPPRAARRGSARPRPPRRRAGSRGRTAPAARRTRAACASTASLAGG